MEQNLLTVLLLTAIFIFVVAIIEGVYLAWVESRFREKRTVRKRLLYISAGGKHGEEKLERYRKAILNDVGAFERFVFSLPRLSNLDGLLLKSQLPINVTLFIVISIALSAIGFLVSYRFMPHQITAAIFAALVCLILPYLFLKLIERKYYQDFSDQLPEALDLLARAMRTGHSLTAGMEMIGTELSDPISSEFAATVDEVNLGLTLKEALDNLCARVPLTDLRFFAIAILVQRETGGNIAEILDNISKLIRDRIKFQRHVKALTAEGRYSAGVLIALPILMFVYIYFTNYDYLSLLWIEEMGRYMMFTAIVLQIIGTYAIKRIVTIEI